MTEKPKFVNTPPEVAEKEKEADKIAEKEAEIQPVIKAEIEEVIQPPKPLEWWIKRVVFWVLAVIVVVQNILPVLRAIKYTMGNNKEITFVKENTDMVKALREYREGQIKEIDTRIISAFK